LGAATARGRVAACTSNWAASRAPTWQPTSPTTTPPPATTMCSATSACVEGQRTNPRAEELTPARSPQAQTHGGPMTAVELESARGPADTGTALPERNGAPAAREVRHEYTRTFPALLNQLGVSLLVSTYQAGKVVAVGAHQGELTLSYHNFERAMGL